MSETPTKPAHSPGPWEANESMIVAADRSVVGDICRLRPPIGCPKLTVPTMVEAYANRSLVIAAPDLLKACQEVLATIERDLDGQAQAACDILHVVRAAVAKATGK